MLRTWLIASRPRTLPAAVVPVAVGTALAFRLGHLAPGPALAALVGALALQIGCNFANDYFDWKSGADGPDRLGPTRVTSAGLVTPGQIVLATALAFGVATLVGLYLAWVGGWPIVAVGVASILAAIAYTGGPYPLGYNGLGEATAFLFFGPVAVAGTVWVQLAGADVPAAGWMPAAGLLSLPVGAWVAAILLVNNLRDIPTDTRVGKRTLAVRIGAPAARWLYAALIALGFVAPAVLVALGLPGLGHPWLAAVVPALALPLSVSPLRAVFGPPEGPPLNAALGATGRLLAVGGLLLAGGLAWG